MKIVAMVARILLGLILVVFGSNHLYAWMPTPPPPPPGPTLNFMTSMMSSHYFFIVGLLEVIPGIMLLINRYVPLALTILGPVIVNILLVSILLAPQGLPAGSVVTILWLMVYWRVRSSFAGIFEPRKAE